MLMICVMLQPNCCSLHLIIGVMFQLKLLCNYLQLVLLTLNVRILWPGIYLTVLKFFASANFITEFVSPGKYACEVHIELHDATHAIFN